MAKKVKEEEEKELSRMNKVKFNMSLSNDTKGKLKEMKKATGLPYGCIIDLLVATQSETLLQNLKKGIASAMSLDV